MRRVQSTVGISALLGCAAWVASCSPSLITGGQAANYGTQQLTPGFVPDPLAIPVISGGDLNATRLRNGCVGWVTRDPDYILRLTGQSPSLRLYVLAGQDTTLLVNAPDGSWHCNDDSYGGLNPTVDLPQAPPGQYDIWVGSYQQGATAQAVLHVTELNYHP